MCGTKAPSDNKDEPQPTAVSREPEVLKVGVADFPTYDGSASPDDFLAQCARLARLGGITDDSLVSIAATRCTGRALSVVNELEQRLGRLSIDQLKAELTSHFSAQPTATLAAMQLSRLTKGTMKAREYTQEIHILVRCACPEFFTKEGTVKTVCVPSYNAALFRHLLVGLTDEDRTLLSRLKVTNFSTAVEELVREESLADTATADPWSTPRMASQVRRASPIRSEETPTTPRRGVSPSHRSVSPGRIRPGMGDRRASPTRRSVSPPARRPSPGRAGPAMGGRRWQPRGTSVAAAPGTGADAKFCDLKS